MMTLQEYDLKIKPTKIIRGQGLCKLLVEAKESQVEEEEGWENEIYIMEWEVYFVPTRTNSWYYELKYYLTHGNTPQYLEDALRLKFSHYQLINEMLFRRNYDGVLLRCLEKEDVEKVYLNFMIV
jgi:hypothetical protein